MSPSSVLLWYPGILEVGHQPFLLQTYQQVKENVFYNILEKNTVSMQNLQSAKAIIVFLQKNNLHIYSIMSTS